MSPGQKGVTEQRQVASPQIELKCKKKWRDLGVFPFLHREKNWHFGYNSGLLVVELCIYMAFLSKTIRNTMRMDRRKGLRILHFI